MPEETVASGTTPDAWSTWKRVAFRFAFLYWALYLWPIPGQASLIDALPWGAEKLTEWIAWPMARLTHQVGVHIFHLTGDGADWHPTGSGDTAMNYVLLAVSLVLAVAGTLLWSALDRKRRQYQTLYAWLRLVLRFSLAAAMFEYGFAKVFPGQFGLTPSLVNLQEVYGDSSPMHVLWFFMGVSRPYTIFGGMAEVVAGLLLLFRKTSTVGLLLTAAVMGNIAALNFCYDVPVKLYSTHLFLMSLFLLLPDVWPMWTFFVRRRAAELTGLWLPVFERKSLRITARVFQVVFLLCAAWSFVGGGWQSREQPHDPSPVRGVWAVDTLQGWTTDNRPKTMVADGVHSVAWLQEGAKRQYTPVQYDAAKHEIRFPKMPKDTVLTWTQTDPMTMRLDGKWRGEPAVITLHRVNPDSYPLLTRGFHWVQENAYNR